MSRQWKWLCADGRRLTPSQMTITHQLNCIRLETRRLMKESGEGYFICAEAVCGHHPLMVEMAVNVRAAGFDPYKDYGGVLSDPNCKSDYPLKDYR